MATARELADLEAMGARLRKTLADPYVREALEKRSAVLRGLGGGAGAVGGGDRTQAKTVEPPARPKRKPGPKPGLIQGLTAEETYTLCREVYELRESGLRWPQIAARKTAYAESTLRGFDKRYRERNLPWWPPEDR